MTTLIFAAILGLLCYTIYRIIVFIKENPGKKIFDYFQNQVAILHLVLSALSLTVVFLMVDWSSIEKEISFEGISLNYAVVIAAVLGWANSSLFMAIMNMFKPKKIEEKPVDEVNKNVG